jgi:hypothetical protein
VGTRNLVVGLACLAASTWLLFLTRGLPPAIMVPVGPAFYPRVVLSIMGLLSVLLIASDLVARRRASSAQRPLPPVRAPSAARANYALVAATFAAFALYVVLLPKLGFRLATVLFVAGLQLALAWPRSWRGWLVVVLVALGTAAACDIAFEHYLSVLLPRGDWTGM